MSIKINGSNITQMRINGYDIKLAKINGSIVFEKVKLIKTFYGDSTQESTTGKNIVNIVEDFNETYTNAGLVYSKQSDGSFVINGTSTGYSSVYSKGGFYNETTRFTLLANHTYRFYLYAENNEEKTVRVFCGPPSSNDFNIDVTGNGLSYKNYTINNTVNITQYSLIGCIENDIAITRENTKVYFWIYDITEGEVISDYEPYTGGQPSPNPDYPQEVKSIISANLKLVGKNLFDVNTLTSEFLNSTNGNISSNGAWKLTAYIEIEPNENYTFGWVSDNNYFQTKFCYYDSNKNFISGVSNEPYDIYCKTFTTPENSKYVRINYSTSVSGSSVSRTDIMLLKGEYSNYNSMLPYEPYKTGTIPINLQGNILAKVGDYADELQIYSNGDVKLVKKTREYKMTGNEDITNVHNNNLFDYQQIFNNVPYIPGSGLSNYYRYNPVQSGVNEATVHGEFALQHWMDGSWHNYNLMFKDTNHNNATDFKNHLAELYNAGTPVKVYYPLLNPTTIQLPSIKSDLDEFGEYSSMDIEVTYG